MGRFRQAMIGGVVVGAVATTIANLKEGFDEPEDGNGGLGAWLLSLVILAVVSLIVWVIATRLQPRSGGAAPTAALVFAVVSFLALAVFWSGASGPLAGAAAALGLGNQGEARPKGGMATAALAVAAVAVVLMVIAAIVG